MINDTNINADDYQWRKKMSLVMINLSNQWWYWWYSNTYCLLHIVHWNKMAAIAVKYNSKHMSAIVDCIVNWQFRTNKYRGGGRKEEKRTVRCCAQCTVNTGHILFVVLIFIKRFRWAFSIFVIWLVMNTKKFFFHLVECSYSLIFF